MWVKACQSPDSAKALKRQITRPPTRKRVNDFSFNWCGPADQPEYLLCAKCPSPCISVRGQLRASRPALSDLTAPQCFSILSTQKTRLRATEDVYNHFRTLLHPIARVIFSHSWC